MGGLIIGKYLTWQTTMTIIFTTFTVRYYNEFYISIILIGYYNHTGNHSTIIPILQRRLLKQEEMIELRITLPWIS
jgi:hypothetical protein